MRAYLWWIVGAAAIAGAPLILGGFSISLMNDIGIAALVALGLVMLSGIGGAVSFGQAAFVGLAAYATGWLTSTYAVSPWIGLLFALAIVAVVASILGLITLRLGGHYLPLSTIAWGISISLVFGNLDALGRHAGLSGIPPIVIGGWAFSDPRSMYYLVWFLVGAALMFSTQLLNSRPGRAMRALRGGKTLVSSVGADPYALKLTLFVLAALYAAIAGWLYAHANRFISPAPFGLGASIEFLLMAVAGGLGSLLGALVGSALVVLFKNLLQDLLPALGQQASQLEIVVFSASFILILHFARGGVMSLVRRWLVKPRSDEAAPPQHGTKKLATRKLPQKGETILSVKDLTKHFGGLTAVDRVTFDVTAGEIVGLIGPNGAGKSTLFNLLTGVASKNSGAVEFLGHDISSASQRVIASMGLARTFQHVKLRPHMTVLDNVALGSHARGKRGILSSGLGMNRAEEGAIMLEARSQLERTGLLQWISHPAGTLPLGTQRILEVARALASDPALLILDEPAAGLRKKEKDELLLVLRQLRDEGVTILIVEHDMDFVMRLVDRLVVMNFGSKLLEGSPETVRADPRVQAAYLGTEP